MRSKNSVWTSSTPCCCPGDSRLNRFQKLRLANAIRLPGFQWPGHFRAGAWGARFVRVVRPFATQLSWRRKSQRGRWDHHLVAERLMNTQLAQSD